MERWKHTLHCRRRTSTWYICLYRWRMSARAHKKVAAMRLRVERLTLRRFLMLLRSFSLVVSAKRLRLIRTQRLGGNSERRVILNEWCQCTMRKRSTKRRAQRFSREKVLRCMAGRTFCEWQQFWRSREWLRTTALRLELVLCPSWIQSSFWNKWVAATKLASSMLNRERNQERHELRKCCQLWHGLAGYNTFRRFSKRVAQVLAWKACAAIVKAFHNWKQSVKLFLRFRRLSNKIVFKVDLPHAYEHSNMSTWILQTQILVSVYSFY